MFLLASFAFIYTGCNEEDGDVTPSNDSSLQSDSFNESTTDIKEPKSNQKSSLTVYTNFDMTLYDSTLLDFYSNCPYGIVILDEVSAGVYTLTLDCNGGTNPSGDIVIYRGGSEARANQVYNWIKNGTIIGYDGCEASVSYRSAGNGQTIWETKVFCP